LASLFSIRAASDRLTYLNQSELLGRGFFPGTPKLRAVSQVFQSNLFKNFIMQQFSNQKREFYQRSSIYSLCWAAPFFLSFLLNNQAHLYLLFWIQIFWLSLLHQPTTSQFCEHWKSWRSPRLRYRFLSSVALSSRKQQATVICQIFLIHVPTQ